MTLVGVAAVGVAFVNNLPTPAVATGRPATPTFTHYV